MTQTKENKKPAVIRDITEAGVIGSSQTVACSDRAALAMALFKIGCRDITKATALFDAIFNMNPKLGVNLRADAQTIQLSFCWTRTQGNVRTEKLQVNSDDLLDMLRKKVRTMTHPYSLQVVNGQIDSLSFAKLIIPRVSIIALFGRGFAPTYRYSDKWAVVSKHLESVPQDQYNQGFKDDLTLVTAILAGEHKPELSRLHLEDFVDYYSAYVKMDTTTFLAQRMGYLSHNYPTHIRDKWRFITIHNPNGQTSLELIRVDPASL